LLAAVETVVVVAAAAVDDVEVDGAEVAAGDVLEVLVQVQVHREIRQEEVVEEEGCRDLPCRMNSNCLAMVCS